MNRTVWTQVLLDSSRLSSHLNLFICSKPYRRRLRTHVEVATLKDKCRRLKVVFADAAYKRQGLPNWLYETYHILLQAVLRPVGIKGFVILPKRWVVERTFASINGCRRNSKDYESNPASSIAMIQITMIALMLNRLEKSKNTI